MGNTSKYLAIRDLEIFNSLPKAQKENLIHHVTHVKVNKGDYVYHAGDAISNVYIVINGSVKTGLVTSNSNALIKEIVYKNEFVGENVLSGTKNRSEFAQALTDVELFKFPVSYFKALLEQNPELCQAITRILITKMSHLEQRMSNYVFKKAHTRIVNFLKEMADVQGIKIGLQEVLINHGLSHIEIANITDTSRQTVARVLGELKRGNLIHFSDRKPSKILIRNILNLS